MLQVTPEGRRLVQAALGDWAGAARAGAAPVTLPLHREKRKKRKADQIYRRKLIDQTAAIMRRGEPSVFAFEGFMRHGLRSGLCLRGWSWAEADDMAAEVVRLALQQIGAKRPTYQQGQPEWAQDGVILIDRERCIRCGWQLPEGHRKFCGRLCLDAHHQALYRRFTAEELEAVYDVAP